MPMHSFMSGSDITFSPSKSPKNPFDASIEFIPQPSSRFISNELNSMSTQKKVKVKVNVNVNVNVKSKE